MADDPTPRPSLPSPYLPGPATAPLNGLGIAALILGIIGVLFGVIPVVWVAGILGIIGLILGLVGLGRVQRGEATNGTMALWGVIASVAAVVLSLASAVFSFELFADPSEETVAEAESTADTTPEQGENIYTSGVEVGDCLAEATTDETFSVEVVPCSEPHSHEIYASADIPDGDGDFPGYEAIDAQAAQSCTAEFESFVGLPPDQSVLEFRSLTPSEQTWDAGDRTIYCAIYDPAGDVTGSLRDAER